MVFVLCIMFAMLSCRLGSSYPSKPEIIRRTRFDDWRQRGTETENLPKSFSIIYYVGIGNGRLYKLAVGTQTGCLQPGKNNKQYLEHSLSCHVIISFYESAADLGNWISSNWLSYALFRYIRYLKREQWNVINRDQVSLHLSSSSYLIVQTQYELMPVICMYAGLIDKISLHPRRQR